MAFTSTTSDIIVANMLNTRILPTIAALGLFLLQGHITGQSAVTGAIGSKVSVAFFANDGHDRPVSGVTQADVAVLDNKKVPQSIVGIRGRTDLPLRLGLLIDTSNSERSSSVYQAAVQAASDFLNQSLNGKDDKVFVESFDILPNATQFMTKHELSAFKIDLTPSGATALYDALRLACDDRMKNDPVEDSLRVIVVLSDGDDNQSRTSRSEAIASAQRAGVVIFAVSTGYSPSRQTARGDGILKALASETGGLAFLTLSHKEVPKVFATIRDQIDNMQLLSYVPADPGPAGQYHSLELKPASTTKLRLRAPKGYYGSLKPSS